MIPSDFSPSNGGFADEINERLSALEKVALAGHGVIELGLASAVEKAALAAPVPADRVVTETFEEYRLAAIRWIARGETTLHVLGLISSGKVRTTSDVVALDLERGWARTKSGSLYHLIAEGAGQPAPLHILAFCTTLHSWGLGGALGLPMIAPRRTDPAAPPGAAGRWLN